MSYAVDALEYRMSVSLTETLKTIKKRDNGIDEILANHFLKGNFIKLANPKSFQEVLFPGINNDQDGKLTGLPQSLKEVLEWKEIAVNSNKVVKSAAEVLKNIKAKGSKEGSQMDEKTEMVLLPQIVQEALANHIIELVRGFQCKVSNTVAQLSQAIASPDSDEAQRDQLLPGALKSLSENHFAIQSEFLGAHWSSAISKDCIRYIEFEKMTWIDELGNVVVKDMEDNTHDIEKVCAQMNWIEADENLSRYYPALTILLDQLHALPHELNAKYIWDGPEFLQASRGCTMLVRYPAGSQQALRLDCKTKNLKNDSGIRMTAIYHIRRQQDDELNPLELSRLATPPSLKFIASTTKPGKPTNNNKNDEVENYVTVQDDW